MRVFCLGIPLDITTQASAIATVLAWLGLDEQHYVVTPNPEMVMLAKKDRHFREALSGAALALPDGIGLAAACRALVGVWPPRIPGTDFLLALLQATGASKRIFFLGGEAGVASRAGEKATILFGATVVGIASPPRGTYDYTDALRILNVNEHFAVMQAITDASPDLLVVALGHGQQEKWLAQFLKDCPSVRVGIGVGGALDYLCGDIARAPQFFRTFGLEWLWRFGQQPQRFPRIFTAIIKFPIEVLRWSLSSHFRYRPNVVPCIINRRGHILLVQRADDPEHWQLPQGGQERDETQLDAARREAKEEVGLTALRCIGKSASDIHRYAWPHPMTPGTARVETNNRQRSGFRGQRQSVIYFLYEGDDTAVRVDGLEHIGWQWVTPERLLDTVHPVRRPLIYRILDEIHTYAKG